MEVLNSRAYWVYDLLMSGTTQVGVGGSGRQSLTRLCAYVSGQDLIQLTMAKAYSLVDWHEDLKRVLRTAGETNK